MKMVDWGQVGCRWRRKESPSNGWINFIKINQRADTWQGHTQQENKAGRRRLAEEGTLQMELVSWGWFSIIILDNVQGHCREQGAVGTGHQASNAWAGIALGQHEH